MRPCASARRLVSARFLITSICAAENETPTLASADTPLTGSSSAFPSWTDADEIEPNPVSAKSCASLIVRSKTSPATLRNVSSCAAASRTPCVDASVDSPRSRESRSISCNVLPAAPPVARRMPSSRPNCCPALDAASAAPAPNLTIAPADKTPKKLAAATLAAENALDIADAASVPFLPVFTSCD